MNRRGIIELIKAISGQANILTIPRLFIDLCDGDHLSALLLSQCIYWGDRTKDPEGWFYKYAEEWFEELAITYKQLQRISKYLEDEGLIKRKRTRLMEKQTIYYKVDFDTLISKLTKGHFSEDLNLQNVSLETDKTSVYDNGALNESKTTNTEINNSADESALSVSEYKERIARAIRSSAERKLAGEINLSWMAEYQRPLAVAFIESAGSEYAPSKDERSLWRKVINKWVERRFTPDDVKATVRRMRQDNLTIAGPQSITNMVRDVKARQSEKEEIPLFRAEEQ